VQEPAQRIPEVEILLPEQEVHPIEAVAAVQPGEAHILLTPQEDQPMGTEDPTISGKIRMDTGVHPGTGG